MVLRSLPYHLHAGRFVCRRDCGLVERQMKQYAPLETAKQIGFDAFYWPFKKAFPDNVFDGESEPKIPLAIAGSILRKKETVHDIDIVVGSTYPPIVEWIQKQIESNDNKNSYNLKGALYGLHTDVWLCPPEEWAPMLLFATGPRRFNIFMRKRAKDQGMVLNQKGLFERTADNGCGARIDNNLEGNIIWHVLHRRWIPPEERY